MPLRSISLRLGLARPRRFGTATVTFAAALCVAGGCSLGAGEPPPQLLRVEVEDDIRHTAAGDRVPYSLFLPQPDETQALTTCPTIVLTHGFGRSRHHHRNTAHHLAERGIVVLTPDMTSLLGGESAQRRNIENLVDHVRWLRRRATDPNDALFSRLDGNRIGLAGHSAGGSVSLEAAIDLALAGEAVSALLLLDGVPWTRTLERAADLPATAFASVRSEPAACNAEGATLDVLARLSFAIADIRVVGASHCDPENPSDILCAIACGGRDPQAQTAYRDLLHAFFCEALSATAVAACPGFTAMVEQLAADGRVVSTPLPRLGEKPHER